MESYVILNVIGLGFDMLGVLVVFLFGISPRLDLGGHDIIVTKEINDKEIKKTKRYKLYSWLGLFLIFSGFLLQLVGNLIR
jgi:hypothetical protein